LAEVRRLTEAAVTKGVVTQLGTQHASGIGDRMTVEFLKGGVIGRIKHVYLCSNRAAPNRIQGPRPPQGTGPLLLPLGKFKNYPRPKLKPRNHYHHFVDACLGGEKTESHFAQTAPMTETILLGTIAIRCFGQNLTWDSARMKFPGCPDAERYLRRDYRAAWEVE